MADRKTAPAKDVSHLIPTDPDNVPVRVANNVVIGYMGSLFNATFITDRMGFEVDGSIKVDNVIAARLRFDIEIAKSLRDQLDRQIAALTPPPAGKAN